MERFDFSHAEYEHFKSVCDFSDDELVILEMRRRGKSIIEMKFRLNMSERSIHRCLNSIKRKISREIR